MPRKPQFGRIYRPKKKLPDGSKAEIRIWWIEFYANGRQVRESSKSRRYKDAEALLRRRVAEMETGTYTGRIAKRVTVGDLLDDVLKDYEVNGQFLERANTSVKHLAPFFGEIRAARVETKTLNVYVTQRRSEAAANATINREVNGQFLERANTSVKHLAPFFGEIRAARVETKTLNVYVTQRRSEAAANATINRDC